MEKVIIELEAKTDKALKGIDNVAKSVEDLNKSVVKGNKDTADGLKDVEKSSNLVGKGIKGIGTAIKAAGIGLVLGLLATLKDLFEQNQKAVDLFNVVFETSANVVGQVVNAFTDIYDALTKSSDQFDALGKVMSGILTIVLTPFKNTFYAIQLAIQNAQLIWEKSFFGDKDPATIKALNESILETEIKILNVGKAALNAGKDIYDNFSEAVTEVGAAGKVVVKELGEVSVSAALNTAKANVELQKSAELAAARQGLIFETFDRQAEKLRQIRDDETKSITERKKANDELLVKIADAEESMLSQAKMQLNLANQNLQKDKDNVEFKVAQIEAEKELAGVRAQIEGIRSEQMSNANALDRESLELTNSKLESESLLSIEQKRFNAEQIEDELLRLEKLAEIDLLEAEQETIRLQAIVDNANAGTQAKIDAQIVLDEFTKESEQTSVTRAKEISKAKIDIAKKEQEAKSASLNGYASALSSISGVIGQETEKGKALAIASSLVNTYAAITGQLKAFSGVPVPGFAIAQAIATGVAGFANVKKIASVKVPNSSGGGSAPSGGSTPAPSAPSLPPAFNVVGASDTNQLADAIGGQSQEPTRAYVVSGDVTSAQSMDRNIIDGASI